MYASRVQRLTVWIYKGSRRAETYLYVPTQDNFERVPDELLDAMGRLELVMELEIHAGRRLARVDAVDVMKSVARAGYFLQLPPIEPEGKRRIQ